MKKIKFALLVIKIYMKNQLQDKTNLILDCVNMVSRCLIVFLLYSYIFKINNGSINGTNYQETLWSMFIYFCLMTLSIRKINELFMADVKSGNVEMYMNKPINYVLLNFYRTIGKGLFSFIFISIIGSILMFLFVGFPNINLAIFIPSLIIMIILGQLLGLILYSCIGLLAFFIEDIRPVYWITDKLVMVLGGSYLPISLFPTFLKIFAFISPFGAVNFATSTVFNSWSNEFIYRLLIVIGWIFISYFLLKYLFRKTKEKAMINGG